MKSMNDKPMLFSGPMIRALLEGRKTQTRRMVKNPDWYGCITGDCPHWDKGLCEKALSESAPYPVGTRLWVRESWGYKSFEDAQKQRVMYKADTEGKRQHETLRWRPSIHMPRWASRITLEVTGVKAERVQDISEDDVFAEGVQIPFHDGKPLLAVAGPDPVACDYLPAGTIEKGTLKIIDRPAFVRAHYAALWDSINGRGSWAENPWVWAYTFKVIQSDSQESHR